jgi:beta-N-acetylhexosaminidase
MYSACTMSAQTTADDFHPGQLVMVGIRGKALDDAQAAFLRRHHLRAVVLFRDNLGTEEEVRALTADLREVMGPRALISLDQEGGAVVRATFLPHPPAAMALGAAGDASLAHDVGAAVARGIRSIGFNWNFAPVLDVNNNPANPVIAERSFSANPEDVARLGGAWMRGALSERVACCVKHFPGHGDTHVDSHVDLPVVDKPREALDMLELVPFRTLRDEAPAMMTAHIVYPQIDPGHPATLSRAILGGLLRDEWRYDGVVITDSLVMKAIHDRYGHDRAAVLALQAGADMVMALGALDEQAAAIAAIQGALDRGELDRRSLLRSRARLDALAARFPVDPGGYSSEARRADDELMRRAWARSLTALGGAKPPPLDQPLRIVTQRDVPGDGISEPGLSGERVATLFKRFEAVDVMQVDDLCALDWSTVARDKRPTVLASNTRARYGKHASAWRPELHLVLWNPFQALDVAAPTIITWGYGNGAVDALRAWLEGRGDAPGRAPVPIASP